MTIPIIGIDAEWQTNVDEGAVSVLSYQWFGLDGDREWSGIHYPDLDQSERSKRADPFKGTSLLKNFNMCANFLQGNCNCETAYTGTDDCNSII